MLLYATKFDGMGFGLHRGRDTKNNDVKQVLGLRPGASSWRCVSDDELHVSIIGVHPILYIVLSLSPVLHSSFTD